MAAALPPIPGYRMLRLLGEGGMGQVFLAEDEVLARRVAIKRIGPRLASSPEATARLLREARALATIEHLRVVRVYAYGETEGQPYFVMEYVEGETLARRLARVMRLPVEESLRMVRETAEALAAAWRRGIVHRDVKPSNILLDGEARVRVADFGLARALAAPADPSLTGVGLIVGTPWYISPEQARQDPADFRSDIYSLGVVLFEMLAGRRPFTGDTPLEVVNRHLNEPFPMVSDSLPDVPPRVDELLRWMTEKDPQRRPPSYAALLRCLGPGGPGGPGELSAPTLSTSTMPSGSSQRARNRRGRRYLVGGILAALVGLALLVGRPWPRPALPGSLAIAVFPFSGPDEESAREGRVLAALLEQELERRVDAEAVPILGLPRTKATVENAAAARGRGRQLGAGLVVWGEVLAFRGETEVRARLAPLRSEGAGGNIAPVRTLAPLVVEAFSGRALEARRALARAVADDVLEAAACEASARGPEGAPAFEALRSTLAAKTLSCEP